MRDPAINSLWSDGDKSISFDADCSKLPHLVRAYVAWKHRLPFIFTNAVERRFLSDAERDLRYNRGDKITDQYSVPGVAERNINSLAIQISNNVSTAVFRVLYDKADDKADELTPEFYSAPIEKAEIRPGTVLYDPNGHLMVVYKVDSNGRVWYVDSHPDKTLSIGLADPKFSRGGPWQGAGYKNWRPLKLVGYTKNPDGSLSGGKIHLQGTAGDEALDNFTQYIGDKAPKPDLEHWSSAKYSLGETFYDHLKAKLKAPNANSSPPHEIGSQVFGICLDAKARALAVELAGKSPKAGLEAVRNKRHPNKLPANIYGSPESEWETFSTPSRDARLKVAAVELLALAEAVPSASRAASQKAFVSELSKCSISYVNSSGVKIKLALGDIGRRLFLMSFDPYHCPELRWGAEGAELSTCPASKEADQAKMEWYKAEQGLRNQTKRNYEIETSYGLRDLVSRKDVTDGAGLSISPDTCVGKRLGLASCWP